MRRVRVISHHLQSEVGFDARRDIEITLVEQWPAAVIALNAAQVSGQLGFDLGPALAQILQKQDVFRGDRRIGFEGEDEMPVRLLQRTELSACIDDQLVEGESSAQV